MKTIYKLTLIISIVFICFSACKQDEAITKAGLNTIYIKHKNGSIDECSCNGQKVYLAGLNYYDAGSGIYDSTGRLIAIGIGLGVQLIRFVAKLQIVKLFTAVTTTLADSHLLINMV